MLSVYYEQFFPFNIYCKWLSFGYGNEEEKSRVFTFLLENDTYVEYKWSDMTVKDFRRVIQKYCPVEIYIGPVYGKGPSRSTPSAKKEINFVVNLREYDDYRTCCSGENACNKCWRFMSVACKILDSAFKEDFHWKHRLWLYSGCSALYCWISDIEARTLNEEERVEKAKSLQLFLNMEKKVETDNGELSDLAKRALNIIQKVFEDLVIEQDLFGTSERCVNFFQMIGDEELRESLKNQFQDWETSIDRWKCFVSAADSFNERSSGKSKMKFVKETVMLRYMYPRFDVQFPKSICIGLRSPFSVHPKTGKICVPFLTKYVENFDPCTTPTVELLLRDKAARDLQMKSYDEANQTANAEIYKKTSLCRNVAALQQCLRLMRFGSRKFEVHFLAEEPVLKVYAPCAIRKPGKKCKVPCWIFMNSDIHAKKFNLDASAKEEEILCDTCAGETVTENPNTSRRPLKKQNQIEINENMPVSAADMLMNVENTFFVKGNPLAERVLKRIEIYQLQQKTSTSNEDGLKAPVVDSQTAGDALDSSTIEID